METTVGNLMVQRALPEEYRGRQLHLDKAGTAELLKEIATGYPEQYAEISKKLMDVGRDVAFTSGGHSFGLKHLRQGAASKAMQLALRQDMRNLLAQKGLTDAQREHEIVKLAAGYQRVLPDQVFEEAKREGNPLAMQVISGARGNRVNLNSLKGGDLLYVDHRGNPIPLPVDRSYAQGLTPAQYFAGGFGTRKSLLDLKLATADVGFMGKQLGQAAHRLIVTAHDSDEVPLEPRGMPVDTNDPDNEGALLAHDIGGYTRNTELTPKILKDLQNRGHERILVRSPTVGGPADGGVFARDVGRRERGGLPPIGDYVGLAGAAAVAEPITQSAISSKHGGGVSKGPKNIASGFKWLNALTQSPKTYPGRAVHAQRDGTIGNIRSAPQGGHYVTISGEEHYTEPGHKLLVKPGQDVEAGDVLTDGPPNPAQIVEHKGIGEGRRYFTHAFREAIRNSGQHADRRNIELIARGLINHVELTEEHGEHVPGDVIPYSSLEHTYEPRKGSQSLHPSAAVGQHLERPVLHHAIGTKIKKSMLPELAHFGVTHVTVHPDLPIIRPIFLRGMSNVSHDPDVLTRLLGSYQQKSLLSAVQRGGTSDIMGSSFVPALAEGASFGLAGLTKGWKASKTTLDDS